MTLVTWILVRALFMHLQICWDIAPTKHHYIAATIAASTVTIGLVSAVLAHAGVSFRFGGYCHVNHTGSIATYWAWLLAFSGLALLLQLATFAYCIKVYLQVALLRSDVSAMSTTRSGQSGGRKGSARAAARRLRMVLLLQWRSLAIVALAIFTTAFVCVVFIVLDNRQERLAFADTEALVPWIVCMILTRDNEQCLDKTGPIIIPERITVATLFILAFVGIEAFVLLCRTDVFRAWWDLVRKPFGKKKGALVAPPEVKAIGRGQRFGSAVSAEMAERIGSASNEAERADSTAERGEVVRATSTERVERTSSATAAPHAL
ncbi:hypothetical protein SLS56_006187 [Neofusicoccum ribis]|uniref:G-protein coupled receptors family 2 profile 2 domain-containing protein n=1 Tax=Neofusicoccum ribis TaxID=45134 RepID=A0ABR3SRI4_9PEZI